MTRRPRKFTLSFDPKAEALEKRYPVGPASRDLSVAAMVAQLRPLDETVRTALERQGYGNTDIMAGITYPQSAEGAPAIPDGFVEVYLGHLGDQHGESHVIPEWEYLEVVKQMLVLHDNYEAAAQIKGLQDRLGPPGSKDRAR